jgi:sugar phosphate isomerase/epimerase
MATALASPALWAKNKIDRSRVSAISDEIATSPEGAIAFAHQYGMKWLELRDVPGQRSRNYFLNEEPFLRDAARQFKEAGIGISFLNANLLKFSLPGTEPVRRVPETPEARERRIARDQVRFDQKDADLRRSIAAAQILGCRYLRVFAFTRVREPESVFPRIADILGGFAAVAGKEGVTLLLENETSCNIARCSELAAMMKAVPSKGLGINWDASNGADLKEPPLPDGYDLLPKKRLHNVQIKGRTILDYPQKLDWAAIFEALARDGYKDCVGLETHIFGPELVARSHDSLRAILRIVDPAFVPREPAGKTS